MIDARDILNRAVVETRLTELEWFRVELKGVLRSTIESPALLNINSKVEARIKVFQAVRDTLAPPRALEEL